MPKRFFKLTDDVYLSARRVLEHPFEQEGRKLDDPWQLRLGQRAHPEERIRLLIKISGRPLDYSHAAFSIPIVHARVASLFTEVTPDDVQLVPLEINSQPVPCWRSRGSAEIWTGTANGVRESAALASSSALRLRLARGGALLGGSAPAALPLTGDDAGVVDDEVDER
jgi:hypothetical protein